MEHEVFAVMQNAFIKKKVLQGGGFGAFLENIKFTFLF
jgi:hypothetical protein